MRDFLERLKRFYWLLYSESHRTVIRQRLKRRLTIVAAYLWRRLLRKTVFIAVSGSVGKTTAKECLADILEQQYTIVRTPGNWNSRKFGGIEATILMARPWHRFAVVEVGVEKRGDMRSAARFLKPDIAVMLGVKRCHTNVFKTLHAIAEEKSQLLRNLGHNAHAVINQDDAQVAAMASDLRCKVTRFGSDEKSDFRVLRTESRWPNRLSVEFQANGGDYSVTTRLLGTHWTPTIMASLSTAVICGVPLESAIDAIGSIEPFWARMQPVGFPSVGVTIIRDEWNGSIDTFDAAFTVMEEAKAARKIVVFSDYSDTNRKLRARANHLGKAVGCLADLAVFVGDYAERSAKAAIAAGLDPSCARGFLSLSAATDFLRGNLRKGDLVLIKGHASHHLSRIYLGLFGEVKCTKSVCAKQILCDRCPELGFRWDPKFHGYMAPPGSFV